jgi:hypothetical protein
MRCIVAKIWGKQISWESLFPRPKFLVSEDYSMRVLIVMPKGTFLYQAESIGIPYVGVEWMVVILKG